MAKLSMDDRIDMTRKNIGITPIQSEIARTNGLPGFFISFKASDPRTAQLVCGEIQSLFVSENLSDRAASAAGTTDFLKGQLADAKAKLDEQDAKLAKFQQTICGKLPGAESSNINMLTTLNTQLDAATQALARMEQDKTYAESILAMQHAEPGDADTRTWRAGTAGPAGRTAAASGAGGRPDLALHGRLSRCGLRQEKDRGVATEDGRSAPATDGRGARLQLPSLPILWVSNSFALQIRAMDQGIAQKKRDQAAIQAQLHLYQERVASSPAVEEEYKSITRDNQTAQAFYDDLLNKMNQSKMATDLEKRQQGEQFRVMDEPNLPESPSSPKRHGICRRRSCRGIGAGPAHRGPAGVSGYCCTERARYLGVYQAADAGCHRLQR